MDNLKIEVTKQEMQKLINGSELTPSVLLLIVENVKNELEQHVQQLVQQEYRQYMDNLKIEQPNVSTEKKQEEE